MSKQKFQKLPLESLLSLKQKYDDAYYNTSNQIVDDQTYDLLCEVIKSKDPSISFGIGCKLREGENKIRLPFHLGSMEKVKKDEERKLNIWLMSIKQNKDEFIISDKLNGVSCLISYSPNQHPKMYTRGDGEEGSDISYFFNKIKNIPKLSNTTNLNVRGEIIIKEKTFNQKYKNIFKNCLGLIVGAVNSKDLKESVYDLEFIAHEMFEEPSLKPSQKFKKLKDFGFHVVNFGLVNAGKIKTEDLANLLDQRRVDSDYEMDGLIVQPNIVYDRTNITPNGNPKYAIAFKMLSATEETTVLKVEWNVSKWGKLTPRIQVSPVILGGSEINFATAFNAKYIVENKLGPGSKVLLTKSGDVIPQIVQVLTQTTAKMPEEGTYEWNETNVDIFLKSKANDDNVIIQQLVHFFVSLKIKQINEGVVKKLVQNKFDTILKILEMTTEDLLKIPTFEAKMAQRIWNNIHSRVNDDGVFMFELMVASGIFGSGLGLKKAEALTDKIDLFGTRFELLKDMIAQEVEGFSDKTALKITENLPIFKQFLKDLENKVKIIQKLKTYQEHNQSQKNIVQGKIFVFSGFRDKDLENKLISMGGTISDSISQKTYMLIVNDHENTSSKVEKAKKYNITISLKSNFITSISS